jgi:hypothetical protein
VLMANSDFGESIYKELVEQLSGVVIPWYWEGYTPYRPMVRLPDSVMPDIAGKYEAPDGKIRAVITLVNGRLKVASETFQLPPTNLYAGVDGHFFLKTMDVGLDFVRGADGKVVKALVNDEGEKYELMKVK